MLPQRDAFGRGRDVTHTTESIERTFLFPCALLLVSERPAHGYHLMERLAALGLGGIEATSLYRALRSMEHTGLLCSEWEASDSGPARRVYTITDSGRATLAEQARELRDTHALLHRYLDRYEASVSGNGQATNGHRLGQKASRGT